MLTKFRQWLTIKRPTPHVSKECTICYQVFANMQQITAKQKTIFYNVNCKTNSISFNSKITSNKQNPESLRTSSPNRAIKTKKVMEAPQTRTSKITMTSPFFWSSSLKRVSSPLTLVGIVMDICSIMAVEFPVAKGAPDHREVSFRRNIWFNARREDKQGHAFRGGWGVCVRSHHTFNIRNGQWSREWRAGRRCET